MVVIAGAGVGGYNGTFTITAVPTPRSFTVHEPDRRPRQLGRRHGRRTSRRSRSGSAGTTRPSSAARPCLHARRTSRPRSTRSRASPARHRHRRRVDGLHAHLRRRLGRGGRAELQLVNLSCGGCFASVEETNPAARTTRSASVSTATVSARSRTATNYTALESGRADADPARGRRPRPSPASAAARSTTRASRSPSAARSPRRTPRTSGCRTSAPARRGFVGETDKGGAVDNKGGTSRRPATRSRWSTAPAPVHDPAPDAVRPHRQRDRRGRRHADSTPGSRTIAAARPARRCSQHQAQRPAFRHVPEVGRRSARATRCSTTRRARTT